MSKKVMKKFHFIVQSKGGVGKSFLTYMLGVKHQENDKSLFLDVDGSTKTSETQLGFLKTKKRVAAIDLQDYQKRIARDKLFGSIEEIAGFPFENYFLDFGAPESEQLPALFSRDVSQKDFKEFAEFLNSEFIFHIVIAGGTAYVACMEYLTTLYGLVGEEFKIIVWLNESMFQNYQLQIDQLEATALALEIPIARFGNIGSGSVLEIAVVNNIQQGLGQEGIDKSGFLVIKQMNKLISALTI